GLQVPQDGLRSDDLGVVAAVGGAGDVLDERVDVADAPNAGEVAALGQVVVDDDRVDGCAIEVAGTDRLEDRLVGGPVEVPGVLDDLGDVGDGVARQQHRAEDAHLRGEVLRRRGSFRLVVVVGHLVLPFLRSAPGNWATVV